MNRFFRGVFVLHEGRLGFLLTVAIVAALVRLAVVPWLDWQRDQIDALITISSRLDRSIKLSLSQQQIESRHMAVANKLTALKERFPAHGSVDRFRVDVQQSINQDALTAGVTVRSFDWVGEGALPPSNLKFQVARMEFFGTLLAISRAQTLVEASRPNAIVREVRFTGEVPANARDNSVGVVVISVEFFYRL